MLAKGFVAESRREEEQGLFPCDDEQRRGRRKERARAALAKKWKRTVCPFKALENLRRASKESGHFFATL